MKNKNYHAVGIVPTSNIKTIEKDKIDTPAVKKKKPTTPSLPYPPPLCDMSISTGAVMVVIVW
jgi:hypothetical protein